MKKLPGLALVILLAVAARAQADDCSSDELEGEVLDRLAQLEASGEGTFDDKADGGTSYRVPVHLHVVRESVGGTGDIPVAVARAITVDDLNATYGRIPGNPFSFELVSLDYITSSRYARVSKDDAPRMARRYNKGNDQELDLYLTSPPLETDDVAAWATFPWRMVGKPYVTLRHRNGAPTAAGHAIAHEVGHWLGLLHTFSGGCWGTDFIADTPSMDDSDQAVHACGAPDSCSLLDGADPTDNLMGYADDCRSTLTPGQIARMKWAWRELRGAGNSKADGWGASDEGASGCAAGAGTGDGWALLLVLLALRRMMR